jgi:hypothetical protein
MSGDWIKMRSNLWDDPRVGRICDMTDCTEATAIGALYWLWSTADQHTEDGCMPGLSLAQIDRKTGVKGFASALVGIGWISESSDGIRLKNFDDHNGESAKKRAQTAKRVAKFRACNADETQPDPPSNAYDVTGALARGSVTSALAREEKRREEKINTEGMKGERQRGARLPSDWCLPDEWASWAKDERPDLDPSVTASKFRDYWAAKPGAAGRKLDWLATWRNWVREERGSPPLRVVAGAVPAWKAEQQARMAEFAGPAAAKPSTQPKEIVDVTARIVG